MYYKTLWRRRWREVNISRTRTSLTRALIFISLKSIVCTWSRFSTLLKYIQKDISDLRRRLDQNHDLPWCTRKRKTYKVSSRGVRTVDKSARIELMSYLLELYKIIVYLLWFVSRNRETYPRSLEIMRVCVYLDQYTSWRQRLINHKLKDPILIDFIAILRDQDFYSASSRRASWVKS